MPQQNGAFSFSNPTLPWLNLVKFNTNLGILTSVTLTFNTSLTVNAQIHNGDTINHVINSATATGSETAQGPDGVLLAGSATGTLAGTPLTLGPGANANFSSGLVNQTHTDNVAGANFGLYEGVGVLNLSPFQVAGVNSSVSFSSDDTQFLVTGASNETLNANGTLVYTYQPAGTIPEPGATTFLAAGVLGSLGMILRRRKKA